MKSRSDFLTRALLVLSIGACGLLSITTSVSAANIQTHGSACHNYNASEALDFGYDNGGVTNRASDHRIVICPVARSPLASGATSGTFWVDGNNRNGVSTTCTLFSNDYTGALMDTVAFTSSKVNYDQPLSLPAAQLPYYGYVSVICSLPGFSNAMVRGIISVQ
jgi:hypothetical protein